MKKKIKDIFITLSVMSCSLIFCFFAKRILRAELLIPTIFVLGNFLVSILTNGYMYSVISVILSVLSFNYVFIEPYFAFDFKTLDNFASAVVMLLISLLTCTMTAKLKKQEAIRAESEKESMRANLLRGISHDLRTPLTTIYSSCSALIENKDEFTDEQIDKILLGIQEDSEWLTHMVENLLSITKLDNDNLKITKTPTVLDELVDTILLKFHKRYPNYEVLVEIPEEFITIPMDPMLIGQVAINMLDNAVQHALGMTKLIFRVYIKSDTAVFEFEDNGCGILEEKRSEIFKGGYVPSKITWDSQKRNTGIGLSVCAAIIKAHGGEISAENLKYGGSLFRFILKLEEENEC